LFATGLLRDFVERPDRGWVSEIRRALGMTSGQLAARMGQSQPAVSKLERSETTDRVQLDSLRRAADALDCDLVYALVPRTSLEATVRARARVLATRDLSSMGHGDAEILERRIEHLVDRLADDGRLWDERDAY
jgi:predicted DNA-binding mobile mystery protein A